MRMRHRYGVTLIELLVVISILVLLGALIVPNMTPGVEARKLREAARGVDTFLALAKARAIRNGRPVGVVFTPFENNARACLTLALADVPEVYAGDYWASSARLQRAANGDYTAVLSEKFFFDDIVGQGDLMQFGNKGYLYRIKSVSGTTVTLTTDTRGGLPPCPDAPAFGSTMPYKVFRAPVVYSNTFGRVGVAGAGSKYQLPEGVAIDLAGSVFPGATYNVPAAPTNTIDPVTVVFSPSGGMSAIYSNQSTRYLPAGQVNILIGKYKSIQATTTTVPPLRNWLDPTNFYVSVGHLTGQITTVEVAPVSGASTMQQELFQATAFARDNYATGGR
jgi:prepilin-type N-terminal cleavage/methylation domain-containing protein